MCVRKLPSQKSSTSSLATAPENLLLAGAGAKLTWEVFFNLWKYSSLVPGNGARKLVDGAVMMVSENLLACSK
jgi:hypothetical protein